MKRTMSDMDSDCDDVFTDDSKGTSVQEEDGCHTVNRKRRRGIIEKRRRDRINNSLSELRRLVPAAFEKQGSAKLEKAEILQMTVDHLKVLHSKGMDIFSFDPHKFTMDYHGIGFRECASEVARYLVGMEGMDLQDPLRMRLMSHLQCFAAQRDLALKSSTTSSPWSPLFGSIPAAPTPQYPQMPSVVANSPISDHRSSTSPSSGECSSCSEPRLSRQSTSSVMSTDATVSSPTALSHVPRIPPVHSSGSPPTLTPLSTTNLMHSFSQINSAFMNGHVYSGFSGNSIPPSAVRPYRPWGAEVAY